MFGFLVSLSVCHGMCLSVHLSFSVVDCFCLFLRFALCDSLFVRASSWLFHRLSMFPFCVGRFAHVFQCVLLCCMCLSVLVSVCMTLFVYVCLCVALSVMLCVCMARLGVVWYVVVPSVSQCSFMCLMVVACFCLYCVHVGLYVYICVVGSVSRCVCVSCVSCVCLR